MEVLLAIAVAVLAYLALRGIRVATADNNATVDDIETIWGAIYGVSDRVEPLEKAATKRPAPPKKKPAKKKGA